MDLKVWVSHGSMSVVGKVKERGVQRMTQASWVRTSGEVVEQKEEMLCHH